MALVELYLNNGVAVVTSGGGSTPAPGTSETWVVAGGSTLPSAVTAVSQFHISDPAAPSEVMAVTNTSGTTLTVTRGADGTATVAHAANFTIRQVLSAGLLAQYVQPPAPQVFGQIPVATSATAEAWWAYPGGVFGDGSDGTVVYDGSTTILGVVPSGNIYLLTRDIFCTGITVNAGVTVQTGSCRIFCRGTVTVAATGIIDCSGRNAASSAGGGGALGSNGSLRGSQGGGAGTTTVGTAGSSANTSYGVGNAGAGGTGASGAGGAAGTTDSRSSKTWMLRSNPGMTVVSNTNGGNTPISGASGGGGGGGDTTNSGGGGGGGGGYIMILAWSVVNNGTLQALGGNGFTPTVGNCGGGGAGAGGAIIVYTLTAVTGSGTTNVNPGTPGNGIGSGTVGGTGTVGTYLNILIG